ncbi:GntR family transcriptional regulator [Moorella sp. Hama-1]|uniref:GntR family transcriptional regulator n=1 Tax=Moorella sp. Hama-1 TaxID=2138101 RepID=UPI000D65428C|nr:GntR family transcriptional regulator [Moorella sp. Hama-1]BCV21462.1 putative HTH-type transcriptional regulator YmfC [Moorella sp. Hama-1]
MNRQKSIRRVKKQTAVQEALEILRDIVASLDIDRDPRLPSEEELATQLGISRLTVREALTVLEREGIIARVQGRGTVVNPFARRLTSRIDSAREIGKFIEENGYTVSIDEVKSLWKKASDNEAIKLGINPGEEILVVEKRFLADGNPAAFCIDRIPKVLFRDLNFSVRDLAASIFSFTEHQCNCQLTHDVIEIIPMVADAKLMKLLQVNPGTPLLCLDAVEYAEDGQAVMYNSEYYLDQFIRFTLCRNVAYMP